MHVRQCQQQRDGFEEKEEQCKDERQRIKWRKGCEQEGVDNKKRCGHQRHSPGHLPGGIPVAQSDDPEQPKYKSDAGKTEYFKEPARCEYCNEVPHEEYTCQPQKGQYGVSAPQTRAHDQRGKQAKSKPNRGEIQESYEHLDHEG